MSLNIIYVIRYYLYDIYKDIITIKTESESLC